MKTAVSASETVVGYKLYQKLERSELDMVDNNDERGEKDKTAEEIDTCAKEITFQVWLTSTKLDV